MKELKDMLISEDADLVGFADLNGISMNKELSYGVSIGIKLSSELIKSIHDGPNIYYFEEYHGSI